MKTSPGKQEDTNGNAPMVLSREKLLNEQPELLQQFGMDLLPVLIQVSFLCRWWIFGFLLVCGYLWPPIFLSSRSIVPASIALFATNVSQLLEN